MLTVTHNGQEIATITHIHSGDYVIQSSYFGYLDYTWYPSRDEAFRVLMQACDQIKSEIEIATPCHAA